jgi:adenosylhomocysteine nucleosidase
MYRVAIVAALEREVRPLVKKWRVKEMDHSGRSFRFFEQDATVLVCGGIGGQPARRAAEAVIEQYGPTIIYSVGFCGALDEKLKAGDVIQPGQVINASDGSRVDIREGKGILVSFASVATPEQKAKLRESYSAQVVDMEAAAVARAAQARGIEFAAVKAISDEFDFVFPSMEQFIDSAGVFRQGQFATFATLRPWLWPKVGRLAINSNRASQALCEWLKNSLNRMITDAPNQKLEATHRS